MPAKYDQDAIELARSLYCKYGGKNYDAIEREMQKVYPGWRRQNLVERKDGKRIRFGWVTEYGFDNSLKLHLQKLTESVNDDEQDLYLGIKATRKEMQAKVAGKSATRDDIYQYRDFCKLEIEARRNLDLSRDNLDTFVSGYEKLTVWAGEIDRNLAKLLVKHGEKFTEMAAAHYGKQAEQEVDDGAGPGADEGGDEPASGLGLVG